MKSTLILFMFLLFVVKMNSQDYTSMKYIKEINQSYTSSLDLTKKESKKLKNILLEFNEQLYLKKDNRLLFNKTLKRYTIEIFELLTAEQFFLYKKLVLELEPYKKYKL